MARLSAFVLFIRQPLWVAMVRTRFGPGGHRRHCRPSESLGMVQGMDIDCHLLTTGTPSLLFLQLQDTQDLPSCPFLWDWLGRQQCPLASWQAKGGALQETLSLFPVLQAELYIANPKAWGIWAGCSIEGQKSCHPFPERGSAPPCGRLSTWCQPHPWGWGGSSGPGRCLPCLHQTQSWPEPRTLLLQPWDEQATCPWGGLVSHV